MRGRTRSSAKTVWPVTLAAASTLGSDRPMTESPEASGSRSATGRLASGRPGHRFALHPGCRQLDRLEDLQVPRAAAEVAGQGLGDLGPRGCRLLAEESFRHQQEARRAVAALG